MTPEEVTSLRTCVEALLHLARSEQKIRAVNWSDLRVVDIVECRSLLNTSEEAWVTIDIEEAAPGGDLEEWLNANLDKSAFPRAYVECEW